MLKSTSLGGGFVFTQAIKIDKEIILLSIIYFVLNFLDASLTLWGLNLGAIEEANPAMKFLITRSYALFFGVKIALPIVTGLFCWMIRYKRPGLAALVLWMAVAAYSLVTLVHGYWLTYMISMSPPGQYLTS